MTFPNTGAGELFALNRLVVLADPSVMGRHRWLIVLGLVAVLSALGWIALEIWFGLTQAR